MQGGSKGKAKAVRPLQETYYNRVHSELKAKPGKGDLVTGTEQETGREIEMIAVRRFAKKFFRGNERAARKFFGGWETIQIRGREYIIGKPIPGRKDEFSAKWKFEPERVAGREGMVVKGKKPEEAE